jgi:hypothetical protein
MADAVDAGPTFSGVAAGVRRNAVGDRFADAVDAPDAAHVLRLERASAGID